METPFRRVVRAMYESVRTRLHTAKTLPGRRGPVEVGRRDNDSGLAQPDEGFFVVVFCCLIIDRMRPISLIEQLNTGRWVLDRGLSREQLERSFLRAKIAALGPRGILPRPYMHA